MNASNTTIRLIPKADGGHRIMDAKTGSPMGDLPPGALDQPSLAEQLDLASRRDERRRQELLCGLFLGIAVVVGIAIGVLITRI